MTVAAIAREGIDYVFRFVIPEAYDATVAPALTVHLPSGDVSPALTVLHASASFDADAVDASRRRLTLSAPLAAPTDVVGGPDGHVYIGTSGDGVFAARVTSVNGAVLTLAEPLPREVDAAGIVYWATFVATLPAASVTAAAGEYRYTVTWSRVHAGTNSETTRTEGLLQVVRQPWPGTGLSHHGLITKWLPRLAQLVPHGQQSWDPQIESAAQVLAMYLARDVGADAGNILIGAQHLEGPHAFLLASLFFEDHEPDRAERYRERFEALYSLALRSVHVARGDTPTVTEETHSGSTVGGAFARRTRNFCSGGVGNR